MKTAIIFADGAKQVVLTPENDDERDALKQFTADKQIDIAVKEGSFYGYTGTTKESFGVEVSMCEGGYLRAFDSSHGVVFVLTPKKK